MRFIDTHCHLDFPPFNTAFAETLALATASGVEKIIAVAVTAQRFEQVMALSEQAAIVYSALGLHPVWINQHQPHDLELLERQVSRRANKLVAIGEIGLDSYTPELRACLSRQIHYLQQQLNFAKIYRLPVILHSRGTHEALAKILRQQQLPCTGVIHGFTGSYQQGKQFIDLGYCIGVGGTISYARANKTRNAIAKFPLQSLILETDSPDMPLQGYQGQANRPERILQVFQHLCELRSESPEIVCQQLWHNSLRTFQYMDEKIQQLPM